MRGGSETTPKGTGCILCIRSCCLELAQYTLPYSMLYSVLLPPLYFCYVSFPPNCLCLRTYMLPLLGGQANVLPVSAAQFTRAVDTVKVSCWAVVLQGVCGMCCHMNGDEWLCCCIVQQTLLLYSLQVLGRWRERESLKVQCSSLLVSCGYNEGLLYQR